MPLRTRPRFFAGWFIEFGSSSLGRSKGVLDWVKGRVLDGKGRCFSPHCKRREAAREASIPGFRMQARVPCLPCMQGTCRHRPPDAKRQTSDASTNARRKATGRRLASASRIRPLLYPPVVTKPGMCYRKRSTRHLSPVQARPPGLPKVRLAGPGGWISVGNRDHPAAFLAFNSQELKSQGGLT